MTETEHIEQRISEFINSYNQADLNAILDYYSDDSIKIRSGSPPETKSEFAQRVRQLFEKFDSQVAVNNEEIQVHGSVAFTRGSFSVSYTPKGGGETQYLNRRYLEIWRKEDGRWVVTRAMDNTA